MLWRRFYRSTLWCSFFLVSSILWASFFAPFVNAFMTANRNHPISATIRKRFFPEEWRLFTSQKGHFRVLVPGGYMSYKRIPIVLHHYPETMHFYQSIRSNPISYTIAYCELPKELQTSLFLQEFSDDSVGRVKGKKIQTLTLKFKNVPILENIIQMKLPGTNTIVSSRQRLWIRHKRLYQMVVVTPTWEASLQESERFMNSIEFIPQ